MWEDEDVEAVDDEETGPKGPASFVRAALFFYGAMGCVALLWRMWTPGQSILHPTPAAEAAALGWGPAIAWGVVIGLGSIGVSELLTRWTDLGDALADLLGESMAGIGRGDALLLALASGVAEEMFFRGALQPAVGIFWASVLFGACHFLPRRELALWSLYAVVTGFVLGWLYNWTGHLAAPIAAHVVVNGINLPRLARRFEERAAGARPHARDDQGPPGAG